MPTNQAPSIHVTQIHDTRLGPIPALEGILADATQVPQTTATITYAAVDPGGPKLGVFKLIVPAAIVGSLTVSIQTTEIGNPNWRTAATFQTLSAASAIPTNPTVNPVETVSGVVSDQVRVVAVPGQGGGQSAGYQVTALIK